MMRASRAGDLELRAGLGDRAAEASEEAVVLAAVDQGVR